MPADTPSPVRRISRRVLTGRAPSGRARSFPSRDARQYGGSLRSPAFTELVVDQLHDRGDDLGGAVALCLDRDLRALARDEHQHTHDALAVDLVAVLGERDVARKLR